VRWLVWSVMRCHPEYQENTSALITQLRRLSKRRRFTYGIKEDARIRAADIAVRAFVALERIAKRLNASESRLGLGQERLTRLRGRIYRIISFALRSRMHFPVNPVLVEQKQAGFLVQDTGEEPMDLLPELEQFRRRWGLRFPLPPALL